MNSARYVSAVATLTALGALAACGDDRPTDSGASDGGDAGIDVFVPPPCTRTFQIAPGATQGHAAPLGATATEARAGRLTAAQLPVDRTGLASWAAGDFVLANDHAAVIIEDVGRSALYDPWGGKIVGVAHVRAGALVEPADFNEVFYLVGRYTLETRSVGVLRDGSDGGPAVVRAIGRLKALPFIANFAKPLAPASYDDIDAAIDYSLAPGADVVEMSMTFSVPRPTPVTVTTPVQAFFQHYRMPRFFPIRGFAPEPGGGAAAYVGFVDDGATSWAWINPDGAMKLLVAESGFEAYTARSYTLPACAQTARPVARFVVGRGLGVDGLVQTLAPLRNETLREIRGTVTEANGAPANGVRVHATLADATVPGGVSYLTRASTDATGSFALHVPAAREVKLTAFRPGDAVVGPVEIAATAVSASLRMAPSGTLQVTATESPGSAALPVRVQVLPATGAAPSVPANFGEFLPGNGRLHVAFPPNGVATLRAPVGNYRVLVSRGPEYELVETSATVTAGATTPVSVALRRVVDTSGYLCGDFHIHTHRSPDADDPVPFKLASLAGDGLEVAARSDHEYVTDFAPAIASMGLGRWVFGIPSIELTTFEWGHFGVVPLDPQPGAVNNGAPDWTGRRPHDVFEEMRARPSHPTIIINHPRGGLTANGYFAAAMLDPVTGVPARPELWDEEFTAVEVFTGRSFDDSRDTTVRDWFSLLNHGRRVFAVGSSDSHTVLPRHPVGYPRTCMVLGTDDPAATTASAVRDAAAQGRSVVSGGLFVTATAPGNVGPGQQAGGLGPMAAVQVRVQAPPWVRASELEVIVDGVTVRRIPIPAGTAVERYRDTVQIPVAAGGSWVVFAAAGTGDLAPVFPGMAPFGVTNPIFLRR